MEKIKDLTFQEGLERIMKANDESGYDYKSHITTSLDPEAKRAMKNLDFPYVPDGFRKIQLPFSLDGASQMFYSVGEPDVKVPSHSHDEGDGIRFIVNGSINYNGQELRAGDWMFIPKGSEYSFEVGPLGATFMYCYQCCC